jgi:hypothetical protein
LRRFNDKFLCIVVADDEAAAAYLINLEKYVKYRVKRWRMIGSGRNIST